MNKSDLIEIREGLPGDKNFVLSTFLLGLYYGGTAYSEMNKDIFMLEYHKLAEKLLSSEDSLLRVACLKEDHNVILGYALLDKDGNTLHFVFVKKPWRKIGIMKSLIPQQVLFCTHLTDVGVSLIKKSPYVSFNPFLLNPLLLER